MGNAEYMGCHVYLLRNGLPGADERNVQTWCRQPTWADVEHSTFPRHDAYQPQCGVPEGSGLGFSWPMANGTPKGDGLHLNTIYRDLIAFLTPIVLMQSDDAMDFVQNCFAVSYIPQLDDLSEGRNLFSA